MLRSRIAVVLAGLLPCSLFAAPDPQALDLGMGELTPRFKVTQSSNSNIYSQSVGTGEESDSITRLQPMFQWLTQKDTSSIALSYTGEFASYWDNSADNYSDHTFSFDAQASPTDMFTFNFGASLGKLHDNRGEGSSEGTNFASRREPDEYDINNINVLLDLGRDSAKVGVEIALSRTDIEYTNNRIETRFRDRDESSITGRLYFKATGKTRFFAEVSSQEFEYETLPLLSASLDGDEKRFSVGATWDATGKTTGTVKLGSTDKNFDAASRRSGDTFVWDVDVTWSPLTYSHVYFNGSSKAQETNGTGAFIQSTDFSVNWEHAWSDRFRSNVGFGVGDKDFEGDPRNDDLTDFSVGVDYDWQRWITVGASISRNDRESNDSQFDYDRNIVSVSLDMSL